MYEQLKLDNQLCFRLYTAARLVVQSYYPLLEKLGVTYPQYLVLMVLWEQDGQPVNDIAKRLKLNTNTVTPLLKRMEAEGFLTREKGHADARQMIVRLTPEGKRLREASRNIPSCMLENMLHGSRMREEELLSLAPLLDNLIASLGT